MGGIAIGKEKKKPQGTRERGKSIREVKKGKIQINEREREKKETNSERERGE